MSTTQRSPVPIDLRGMVTDLAGASGIGPEALVVRGGVIPARDEDLERLVGVWAGPALQYLLSLDTGGIRIEKVARGSGDNGPRLPTRCEKIERLRLFGAVGQGTVGLPDRGGDLELRRDREQFLWRYVGVHDDQMVESAAAADLAGDDFWARPDVPRLRVRNRSMLLWGKRGNSETAFFDPRVGWATLNYPDAGGAERMELAYLELSAVGVVELVWWTEVRAHG